MRKSGLNRAEYCIFICILYSLVAFELACEKVSALCHALNAAVWSHITAPAGDDSPPRRSPQARDPASTATAADTPTEQFLTVSPGAGLAPPSPLPPHGWFNLSGSPPKYEEVVSAEI
ncbi:uncharacterized protein PG998_008604 [Apiospora kogelbergensis]|uniref:uncharacterized protein n=1 Tax=Apiospora kogelbergensis TaxID=1337665 RepID=UPI003131D246